MNSITLPAFIKGRDVDVDQSVAVMNPSTGDVLATTADCGPEEIDLAVAAAAVAQVAWRRVAVAERSRLLRLTGHLITRDAEELATTESLQTGKPLSQARRDVEIVARYFDFYASAMETFYGSAFMLDDRTEVVTRFEPHGVTAHIIPWNYPLQILGRSLAPALATGNCCVVKPAEESPLTALKLAALMSEAGFPDGAVNVVPGRGESAGAALAAHPGVRHISFTGSAEVGRLIAHAAAENLIPATLELGGKCPNIIFNDADLQRAIPSVVNSIIQMCGQTCSAGSRLLVESDIHDEVVAEVAARFRAIKIGPAVEDLNLGPLISAHQRERVLSYVEVGEHEAELVWGGQALNGGPLGAGYFIEPALFDNVEPGSPIYKDEIFGPVLTVTPFSSIEEAITLANATEYGLVAGVWTTNINTAQRMSREVESGQVFLNTYGAAGGVELPFGGMRRSGYGREKGAEGLRGFVTVKAVVSAS